MALRRRGFIRSLLAVATGAALVKVAPSETRSADEPVVVSHA